MEGDTPPSPNLIHVDKSSSKYVIYRSIDDNKHISSPYSD